jgi:Xaa-Pro aminopeptidase
MNDSSERLAALRAAMQTGNIDILILPSGDPHLQSEIPPFWNVIQWLTGFTGSNAVVIISAGFAGLWTDSRYFVQAREQLEGSDFEFMRPSPGNRNDFVDWLRVNCREGSRIGIDGRIISEQRVRRIESAASSRKATIVLGFDPFPVLWSERPDLSASPAKDFPVVYSGKDRVSKISEVRERMSQAGADYQLLTSPDDIMWLLNIRGEDTEFSPVISCFALIGHDQVLLFADEEKIPFRLAFDFDRQGIVVLPYEDVDAVLETLPSRKSIIASSTATPANLFRAISRRVKTIDSPSIPSRLKAVRNKTEIENTWRAMILDGTALTKFFYWLDNHEDKTTLTERSLSATLEKFRACQEGYTGQSFAPIVAWNAHAALPHYSAEPGTDSEIGPSGILLIDTGGQYYYGTTDITRTVSIGKPSSAQFRDFTLVLMGHIDLAMAKVPYGTRGIQIDILARKALWDNGLNYGHGTGHGVGFYLNVHESPPSISPADTPDTRTVIEPGMLFSNEPGIYREGEYGIRIENLMLTYEDETTEFGRFLKFETVSLCFIDKTLIDKDLMSKKQIAWLNNYNATVYEKISPFLTPEEALWLSEKTSPV